MNRVVKVCCGLLAAVVACVILLRLFIFGGSRTSTPPPSPNGYDDFVAAGNLLSHEIGNANQMDAEPLRAMLATNQESLRLFQVGLTRTCLVPAGKILTNISAGFSQDLTATKRLAQLQIAVGRLAELEGRTNDAVAAYISGMRYGNEVSRGGFVTHRLAGVACEAIARGHLTTVATDVSEADTRRNIRELEALEAEAVSWADVADNERMFMREAVRQFNINNPIMLVQLWWSARTLVKQAKTKHLNELARRRLLIIELALRGYSTKYGGPPKQLGQLMPEYLARIPLDPFTERNPGYSPTSTNWVIYSFGADRKDNRGNPRSDVRWDTR